MKRLLLLWCLHLFVILHAKVSPSQPTIVDQSLDPNSFQLIWADNFVGNQLNLSNWIIQNGTMGGAYTYPGNQSVFVKNDYLYLRQSNESNLIVANNSVWYSVGRMNSIPAFGYGFFEARILFPNSTCYGYHDSFFLLAMQTFPPPYSNQEIDIIECNMYNSNYFTQHYHLWSDGIHPGRLRQSMTIWKLNQQTSPFSNLTGWNIFGLFWNSSLMNIYMNGGRMLTVVNPSNITNNPVQILLTQALWPNYAPKYPPNNITSYMLVDYVAYYQSINNSNLMFTLNDKKRKHRKHYQPPNP